MVEFSASGGYLSQFGSSSKCSVTEPKPCSAAPDSRVAFGLAVSGGHIYVSEFPGPRVQEFSTSGEFIRQSDEKGSANGKSNLPWGIASDPTTGNLYVTDTGKNNVQEFSPEGSFITAFGPAGSGNEQFSGPKGVAVADGPGQGLHRGHRQRAVGGNGAIGNPPPSITIFTRSETIESKFGEPTAVAVDPSGNIYAADSAHNRVLEFNAKREYVKQLGKEGSGEGEFRGIGGLATDSAGNLYVTDSANSRVEEFNSAGTYLKAFGSSAPGNGQLLAPGAIAIDSSGNVWVLNSKGGQEGGRVVEFSSSGGYLSQFGSW